MITDRQTYRKYVEEDLKAYGLTHVGFYNYWWMDCLRFQLRLRRIEYLHNTAGLNPLVGPAREEWGGRFPDMTEVYCRRLAELLHAGANYLGLRAMDGTYAFSIGPCYETPAEINAMKTAGADARPAPSLIFC